MERSYKNIVYFFSAVVIIIFLGFFKTYFGLFPFFKTVLPFNHFHAAVMILWLLLLIIKPILISKRKYKLHGMIGKFSYFLAPLMVISMLFAYKVNYDIMEQQGVNHAENLSFLFSPFTDVLPFSIFYTLAIKNTKNTPKHMRYIIATSLLVVGAGLVRLLLYIFGTSEFWAFSGSTLIIAVMFIAFIAYDKTKGKQIKTNAFTTAFIIFLIPNALNFFIPQTWLWQKFAQNFVNIIF